MQHTQRKNLPIQEKVEEEARLVIREMLLAFSNRLHEELARPGFLGFVNLEVAITDGKIPKFEIAVKDIIRIKPL